MKYNLYSDATRSYVAGVAPDERGFRFTQNREEAMPFDTAADARNTMNDVLSADDNTDHPLVVRANPEAV